MGAIVVEERLSGTEISAMALVDGSGGVALLPLAADHKRRLAGDAGPNTGGMGTIAPVPFPSAKEEAAVRGRIEADVIGRAVAALAKRGTPFKGGFAPVAFESIRHCNGVR